MRYDTIWIAMKMEHAKRAKSLTGGVPWHSNCSFCHSLLRVLELKGNCSLFTPVLCQTRSSPELHASYRSTHHASTSAKSWDIFGTGWLYRYLVRASSSQQTHPYGRSFGSTSSLSLSARLAGGHSHKRKETLAWYAS